MIGQALAAASDRRVAPWLVAALLAVLVAFPWIAGEGGRYYTVLLMTVFIFATLGHAWNLLAGFCGLLSFGLQVYVGLAGFTVAILNYYAGVNVWWAMILSIVVTAAFALVQAVPLSEQHGRRNTWIGVGVALVLWMIYEAIILWNPGADIFGGSYIRRVIILFLIFLGALPLLKLQGAYFAVATWLIASAVASIFNEWRVVGAGGGMNIANATTINGRYYAGLILVVLATAVVWWLLRSRYGRALTAVRDDEEAATAIGIDIRGIKTMVFLISAPMAGLAAALHYIDQVTITPPDAFHIRWSAYAVFIVVAGGMGTLVGPIIGAVLFIIVQRFLVGFWGGGDLTLGIAAVLLILLLPRGIAGWLDDLRGAAVGRSAGMPRLGLLPPVRPGAIVSASLLPSSPALHLLPGTPDWQGLRAAVRTVAGRIAKARPDTLVLLTAARPARAALSPGSRARVTGRYRDPALAAFGDIPLDIRLDQPLARALAAAGLAPRRAPDAAAMGAGGVAAALAAIDPGGRFRVVVLDLGGLAPLEAAAAGQAVARVVRETGRRVSLVGLGGLSRSAAPVEVAGDPGRLAGAEDDLANRTLLGWLEQGDLLALGRGLPEVATAAGIEGGGAVLAALEAALPGPAEVLAYGAVFGAGAAVTDQQAEGRA
ncbi:MAG: ABC transporter permease subunit [Gemmobacter sp.]